MYFIYILRSKKDEKLYTGFSDNLEVRLKKHNSGKVVSTKKRLPLELIYYEVCLNKKDALHRERYLKTAWGKRYVRERLKNYFNGATVR